MEDHPYPNWKTLATSTLKWKIFVKAKDEEQVQREDKHESSQSMSFDGEEAKEIYESIIQDRPEEHLAMKEKHPHAKQHLENKVAEVSINHVPKVEENVKFGARCKHKAMMYAQNNEVASLMQMLKNGFSVDAKDEHGWSLLMVAACAGSLDVVQTLLKNYAKTEIQDANGNTAIYLASVKGHKKVVDMINAQETGNITEKGDTGGISKLNFTEFFCEVCQRTIKESTHIQHETSITHQFNLGSSESKAIYGISPCNKGYQLMVNQGWNTEKGLGPECNGVKFPVKTILKRNREGLGSSIKEKARVTHFGPGDESAIRGPKLNERKMSLKTLNKIDRRRERIKDIRKERDLRRMLNELDC